MCQPAHQAMSRYLAGLHRVDGVLEPPQNELVRLRLPRHRAPHGMRQKVGLQVQATPTRLPQSTLRIPQILVAATLHYHTIHRLCQQLPHCPVYWILNGGVYRPVYTRGCSLHDQCPQAPSWCECVSVPVG